MNSKRSTLQGYIAGIFDGEGSVGIYKIKTDKEGQYFRYTVKIMVCMRDPLAVSLLWREYPEGRLYKDRNDMFVFHLWDNNCYRFLKEIQPFSIVKHEQVKIALSYLAHYRRNRAKRSSNKESNFAPNGNRYNRRCDKLVEMCKEAKDRANKGVNSVNALLGHELREYRAKRDDVEADVKAILQQLEGVETRLSESNKTTSAPEQELVQG